MHLSSITIKGFKSFPERTKLVFSPGVSVIVGPNGCGKSNITDAVLWALGEQSPLSVRGQSMQDMIFAGGEGSGRRARSRLAGGRGRALDDSPIAPGRRGPCSPRLRSPAASSAAGTASYRLNGARARLADVIETLSDANLGREMHSVISQGRVEEIVLSAPRERRMLVEEAAGLGKHRKRRRRAQLKLERTQDNLDRALDVEREARSRLRPLKRQAQAADIHARLERDSAELRARLLAAELLGHEDQLAGAQTKATRGPRSPREARLRARGAERAPHRDRGAARRARPRAHRVVGPAHRRPRRQRAAHRPRRGARGAADRARRGGRAPQGDARGPRRGARERDGRRNGRRPRRRRARADRRVAREGLGGARLRARAGAAAKRAAALALVRESSEHAARIARRVEDMLGARRQDSLAARLDREAAILAALGELCEAAADARDATGDRAQELERRMVGGEPGDDVTEALRACAREDAEIQAKLRAARRRRHRGAGERRPSRGPPHRRRGRTGQGGGDPGPRDPGGRGAAQRRRARRDRGEAGAPRPPPRAARSREPAGRGGVQGGARARRGPGDPAGRPRDRARPSSTS